jgi:OOP family OmpA-OmpF porin
MVLCALCVLQHYPYTGMNMAPTASLSAKLVSGKVVLTGLLPDQAAKDKLIAQANTLYGAGNYVDQLNVGGTMGGDAWMKAATGLLPLALSAGAGGGVDLNGSSVTVSGQAPSDAAKKEMLAAAGTAAAGMSITDKLSVATSGALLPPFTARLSSGTVTLDGTVPDQASLDRILATATAAFGAGKFVNNIKIAPAGSTFAWGADWLKRILGYLPFLGRFGSRGDITFNGQSVTVSGEVPTGEVKTRLLSDLRAIFGDNYTIADNITVVESLLSELEAKAQANLKELLMKGIEFDTASDRVKPAGTAVLDEAARALTANADANIEISGHTDDRGAARLNQALSQRRAESVKKYLAGKGIAAARMTPKGYGPSQPVADNATDEGRARNRRIEFRVIPKATQK